MKIDWEVVRKGDIERLREIYENPGEATYIIHETSTFGWIKKKITRTIEDIPHTQLLSGGYNTIEDCQNYVSSIEKE